MKMQWIKEQVEKENYQFKLHAVERASIRGIDPLDVKEALLNGESERITPMIREGIAVLFMEILGTDIHVLCSRAYDILWIITVYEPDPTEWINPKTRRVVK